MGKATLRCDIRIPPFFYERRYPRDMALAALFWFAVGLFFVAKAAWCGYSENCKFTLEDHVFLVLSFAFFNMFIAASLVTYVSTTLLRLLNLVEEENREIHKHRDERPEPSDKERA